MATDIQTNGHAPTAGDIEKVLIQGDLSRLNDKQRVEYYMRLCESVGLNPLTQPFDYLTFQGKLTLYAKKSCTEQLRTLHGVSVDNLHGEVVDDCYVVTATGTNAKGRRDSATGAVSIANLKGEAKCNALMKAETKAKRRLTLSLCGLGLLDDSEVDSIPGSQRMDFNPNQRERIEATTGEVVESEITPAEAGRLADRIENVLNGDLCGPMGEPNYNCITYEQVRVLRSEAKVPGLLPMLCDVYQIGSIAALPAADFDGCRQRIRAWMERYEAKHGAVQ